MKKTIKYLAIIIIGASFYGCNKNDKTELDNVSSDEAAEIIAASLSSDNGGTTAQFEDAAKLSEEINSTQKGIAEEVFDTTFIVSNREGARITFEYTIHYEYGITYNADSGQFQFYANFDTDGTLESPRVSMIDNSYGTLTLTGLEQSDDFYTISGSASRQGSQTTKTNDGKTVKSTIDLNFDSIKINKTDYSIDSGNGEVTITGKTSEGNDFSFTGTLVYKSDGTIILTVNGEEYIINTASGEIENLL
ncbi:MAG: hypothetical protein L3J35_08220 [Bacteroidales bacterium]|nr:hypothetical protein [Bacteroidales bacterium]